ncbi:uncharacterized protein M6B38_129985 [Iris pallida]|uniref:Ribosomal protein L34Ae n=1 Tax=Iris pallida TaxID=29817 RepID=A0AAX6G733_IRIPA|nr:uncharacterized protein M6B38_129985 [Iris pallida]
MKKERLDRVVRKEMTMLINILFFMITFIAQLVFRTKTKDGASKAKKLCVLETIPEDDDSEEEGFFDLSEEEEEEEYTSSFSFKFEHQIPGLESISKEYTPILATEEDFSDRRDSISNHQSLSEFAEPEAMADSEENAEPESLSGEEFRNSFIDSIDLIFSNDEHFVSRSDEFLSSNGSEKSFEELKEVALSKKDEPFIGRRESKFLSEKWYAKYFAKHQGTIFPKDRDFGEEEEEPAAVTEGFSGFGTDSDSTSSSDGYSVKNLVVDCDSCGFSSERDFGGDEILMDSNRTGEHFEGGQFTNVGKIHDSDTDLELQLKMPIEFPDSSDDELPSFTNNATRSSTSEPPGLDCTTNARHSGRVDRKSEESDTKDLDGEDTGELESLWEHQDLLEQLRMELKKARATGLPTILEESKSPDAIEDLKQWRIDDEFLREDPVDELHKFYKSYRERMRKFDILNYQKLYAIGFLQLNKPVQSIGSQKPLIPTILSHLSQRFCALHCQKSSPDASEAFVRELRVDLEAVYVGQTCLSWEFLRWQYERAREPPESDPCGSRRYSRAAGEFQKFQVILRRFVENEPFEGPRLPTYVQNRCILRNLLQVPVMKEDCLKEKMEGWEKGSDAITSEVLEDIMEESIRTFWDFIKADNKYESSAILKSLIGGDHAELQDPSDYHLMADVQATLQKMDKKLKDILKTGNCLAKKLKKRREDGSSNQDLFFSQVDVKLVARVLRMSRITTDQLAWCRAKLSKITVAGRKIHREPSFLLFPC